MSQMLCPVLDKQKFDWEVSLPRTLAGIGGFALFFTLGRVPLVSLEHPFPQGYPSPLCAAQGELRWNIQGTFRKAPPKQKLKARPSVSVLATRFSQAQ